LKSNFDWEVVQKYFLQEPTSLSLESKVMSTETVSYSCTHAISHYSTFHVVDAFQSPNNDNGIFSFIRLECILCNEYLGFFYTFFFPNVNVAFWIAWIVDVHITFVHPFAYKWNIIECTLCYSTPLIYNLIFF